MKRILSMLLVLSMVVTTLMGVMLVDVSADVTEEYVAATDDTPARTNITYVGNVSGGSNKRFFRSSDVYFRTVDADNANGTGYSDYVKFGTLSNSDYMGINFNHVSATGNSIKGDALDENSYWGLYLSAYDQNANSTSSTINTAQYGNTVYPSMKQATFTENVTNGNAIHFTTYAYSDLKTGATIGFQMNNGSSSVGSFYIYTPNLYSEYGVPHKIDFFVYSADTDGNLFEGNGSTAVTTGEEIFVAAYLDGRYYGGMTIDEGHKYMKASTSNYVYFISHINYQINKDSSTMNWYNLELHWQSGDRLYNAKNDAAGAGEVFESSTLATDVSNEIFETLDVTKCAAGTVRENVVTGVQSDFAEDLEAVLTASIQTAGGKVGSTRQVDWSDRYYKYYKYPATLYTDGYDNSNLKIVNKSTGAVLTAEQVAELNTLDGYLLSVNGVFVYPGVLPSAQTSISFKISDDEDSTEGRKVMWQSGSVWVPRTEADLSKGVGNKIGATYGSWWHRGYDYNDAEVAAAVKGTPLVADEPGTWKNFLDISSSDNTFLGQNVVKYDYKPTTLVDETYAANKGKITQNYIRVNLGAKNMQSTSIGGSAFTELGAWTLGDNPVKDALWDTGDAYRYSFYLYTDNYSDTNHRGDSFDIANAYNGSNKGNVILNASDLVSERGVPHKADLVYTAYDNDGSVRLRANLFVDGVFVSAANMVTDDSKSPWTATAEAADKLVPSIFEVIDFDNEITQTISNTDWYFVHDTTSDIAWEKIALDELEKEMFIELTATVKQNDYREGYISGVKGSVADKLEAVLSTEVKGDKVVELYNDEYKNPASIFDSDAETTANVTLVNKETGDVYSEGSSELGALTFANLYMVVNGVYITVEDAGVPHATYDAATGTGTLNVDGVAAGNAVVVIAGYSSLGKTEDVKVCQVVIADGDTSKEFTAVLEPDADAEIKYYKVFLFDTITNASPLRECVKIVVE